MNFKKILFFTIAPEIPHPGFACAKPVPLLSKERDVR